MSFSSAFSSAFVRAAEVYIAPMKAQEALFAGASWRFDGGRLKVGGRVLIGLSGASYAFRSAETADTWCKAGKRVIEVERATVERLSSSVRDEWVERKREKLSARAEAILRRAVKQQDEAKRAALVAEAAWCEAKWGAW